MRGWPDDGPLAAAARSARSLDDIVAATHTQVGRDTDANRILHRLVELSATEPLACRIVVHLVLPGLISGARKWAPTSHDDPVDEAIGAALIAIRQFDLDGRNVWIAPALVADALWIAFRRGARRKQHQEVVVPADVLESRPAPERELEPIIALAGTLRAATRAGMKEGDLETIRSIIVAGSPSQAARDCAVSVRTIRNRRDVAAAKIRRVLGPEWSDWRDPVVAAA